MTMIQDEKVKLEKLRQVGLAAALEVLREAFREIIGYDDVKEFLIRALQADKPVNVLLIGPPAGAKSMFLEALARAFGEEARYLVGGATTRAGVARFLVDNPGTLYLWYDELDKASRQDNEGLLSALAQGRVALMKSGQTEQAVGIWRCIATANYRDRCDPPLLSRFTEIHLPEYSDEEFRQVIAKMLPEKEEASKKLAGVIADGLLARNIKDPREAIRIARTAKTPTDVAANFAMLDKYAPPGMRRYKCTNGKCKLSGAVVRLPEA